MGQSESTAKPPQLQPRQLQMGHLLGMQSEHAHDKKSKQKKRLRREWLCFFRTGSISDTTRSTLMMESLPPSAPKTNGLVGMRMPPQSRTVLHARCSQAECCAHTHHLQGNDASTGQILAHEYMWSGERVLDKRTCTSVCKRIQAARGGPQNKCPQNVFLLYLKRDQPKQL